ncbi:MAG: glycerophosphoryl diester phosphodiesterase [Gaiellaceae bacterium]|nr:glycerophosphoryl diester phosphodiesterase [Gaiellaceae bacterium]
MTALELRRGEHGVVRIGHRGAAALAAENSLAAIAAAADAGADAVELDVLRRDDGVLVLAHGPGVPDDAAPLDDALDLAGRLGLAVQVDVKVAGNEAAIVDALRRHELLSRSFVSSFSLPILHAFAAAAPGLPRSFTYPEDRLGVSERRILRPAVRPALAALRALAPRRLPVWLRAAGAQAATLNWAVVSPAAVAACHASGAAVYVWTVNEPALARSLVASGIDGIITDDPRILASRS